MKCAVCLHNPLEVERGSKWFRFEPSTCCKDKSTFICKGCMDDLAAQVSEGNFESMCFTCRKPLKRTRTSTYESHFTEVKAKDLKDHIRAWEESNKGEKRRRDAEEAKPGEISEELQRDQRKFDQDRQEQVRQSEEYARQLQEEEDRRVAAPKEEMDEATAELIRRLQEEEKQEKQSEEQKRLEQEKKDREMALELQQQAQKEEENRKEAKRKKEEERMGAPEKKQKKAKVKSEEGAVGAIKIEDDVKNVTND